jgi:hypothetical protein
VSLYLSRDPITLEIQDTLTGLVSEVLITKKPYDHILADDPISMRWSMDDKMLMFVLYQDYEDYDYGSESNVYISCFVAVDVENARLLTVNYSRLFRGLWEPDEFTVAWLEHGGKNNIFDWYFVGLNCYKEWEFEECISSNISPSGEWEFIQYQPEADVIVQNLSGKRWQFNFPHYQDDSGFIVYYDSAVEGWSEDSNNIFFSVYYHDSLHHFYYVMDLDDGMTRLITREELMTRDYFTVSPNGEKIVYIADNNKVVTVDMATGLKQNTWLDLKSCQSLMNFTWTPDGSKLVFNIVNWNKSSFFSYFDDDLKMISADYLLLDTQTGELRFLYQVDLQDPDLVDQYAPEQWYYLNLIQIMNNGFISRQGVFSFSGNSEVNN